MKCKYCGTDNNPSENYCTDCGSPLNSESGSHDSTPPQPAMNKINCPYCGKTHLTNTTFCPSTGADLSAISNELSDIDTPEIKNAQLVITENIDITLQKTAVTITREHFDRVLSAPDLQFISRNQFTISFHDDRYYIEDAGSKNGTRLNDEEIKNAGEKQLSDGDIITVADVLRITFKL